MKRKIKLHAMKFIDKDILKKQRRLILNQKRLSYKRPKN